MSDSEKSQLGMRTNPAPTSLGTLLNPLPEQIHLGEVLPARLPGDEAGQVQTLPFYTKVAMILKNEHDFSIAKKYV